MVTICWFVFLEHVGLEIVKLLTLLVKLTIYSAGRGTDLYYNED